MITARSWVELAIGFSIIYAMLYGIWRFTVNEIRAEETKRRHPTARKAPRA